MAKFWPCDRFCSILFALLAIPGFCIAQEKIVGIDRGWNRRLLATQSSNASCPVQFDYMETFKSTLDPCKGSTFTKSSCCNALLSGFGIGLGLNLEQTKNFEFSDNATAYACLDAYQAEAEKYGYTTNFVKTCFPDPYPDPSMFVSSASLCIGIINVDDWNSKVGKTAMDTSCKGDLSDSSTCYTCTADTSSVISKSLNSSSKHCTYFACLYGASIVNEYGPTNSGTATCLLGATASVTQGSKHNLVVIIGCIVAVVCLLLFLGGLSLFYILKQARKKHRFLAKVQSFLPNTGLIQFKYEDLKLATHNFNKRAMIGEGGFGTVYKGALGTIEVAVKVMKNVTLAGEAEFLNEMEVINKVRHRNLVPLRGCCVHGTNDSQQRMLVYDFMPNGSVEDHLHGPTKDILTWPVRRKIAIGMATGIYYLHSEIQPAIIHRDIKPSNILLDSEFNARVADFGLAKVTPEGMTHLTTRVAGTPVYIAVEYALYGQLSEKTDVYSFGIVLLELMSGRKALDTSCDNPLHYHIVDWAWSLAKEGKAQEIIDKSMRESAPLGVMERFVLVGILCAHLVVGFRPTMAQVIRMLEGDDKIPEIPDRPTSYISESTIETEYSYNYNHSVTALQSQYSVDLLR